MEIRGAVVARRMRELLDYDPDTGIFSLKKLTRGHIGARIGDQAGTIRTDGYRQIWLLGEQYLAHRLAYLWMTGTWPTVTIDHKDRDRSNNRWENLRHATRSQQAANSPPKINNTLQAKGVVRERKRYAARIMINGIHYRLGSFDTVDEAAAAYQEAAKRHFGEFVMVS